MSKFIEPREPAAVATYSATIARWILLSGRAAFMVLFGCEERAIRILEEWVQRRTSEFSGERSVLPLADDNPVGVLIGVPGNELEQRRRADLISLIKGSTAQQREELTKNLKRLAELTAPVSESDYYFRTVVVDAKYRGLGIGKQLLQKGIADGRAVGFKHFRLDVQSDNEPALRLYKNLGFKPIFCGYCERLGFGMDSLVLDDEP